ncbi:hypothetical protein [Nonomuraea sp. NPDC023979]|uniref:hypothetical protein n=1 Tax=Nonomuraea sp. NPDC023979 TaxID=3154796 RepID=UPI0033E42AC1
MATNKSYTMNGRPLVWSIRSNTDPSQRYKVSIAECGAIDNNPCGDWLHRHTQGENPMCKHIVSAYLQHMGADETTATTLAPLVMKALDSLAEALNGGSDLTHLQAAAELFRLTR